MKRLLTAAAAFSLLGSVALAQTTPPDASAPPSGAAPGAMAPGAMAPGVMAPGAMAPGAMAPGATTPGDAPAGQAMTPPAGAMSPSDPAPGAGQAMTPPPAAGDTSTVANAPAGPPPAEYPPCTSRGQDRCIQSGKSMGAAKPHMHKMKMKRAMKASTSTPPATDGAAAPQ